MNSARPVLMVFSYLSFFVWILFRLPFLIRKHDVEFHFTPTWRISLPFGWPRLQVPHEKSRERATKSDPAQPVIHPTHLFLTLRNTDPIKELSLLLPASRLFLWLRL